LNPIISFLQSYSIQLEQVVDVVDVVHNGNDDDAVLEGLYSLELEESIGSIDSIAGNAYFISLY
jgi:hypothetical protein